MTNYCAIYNPDKLKGDRKIIALMAAHHRLTWIHPFLDGNGWVGRLLTDNALALIPACTRPLKTEAARIIHMAFLQGELDRAEAITLCGGSERTARRLIQQLKEEALLSETSSRSPLKWEIPAHAEAYYFPDMAPG